MEEIEELELITKKIEGVIENCDKVINYCESYKKKAKELMIHLQQGRRGPEFRRKYYKAQNLISHLESFTYELMLELELQNPLEDEEVCEITEVPCFPPSDGESQQFNMLYLRGSSPWNFWLSPCEENITRRLKELLQKRVNNLQPLDDKPICGDYVLYMKGTQLQRAMVQKLRSSDRYQIFDIDKGTNDAIRLDKLFRMDDEISLIPYQAVNCSVMKDSTDSSLWNKEMESMFATTLQMSQLTVKIIQENPGYPSSFFVKMKAVDIDDDTKKPVDIGKWITKRIIPGLKSGSNLSRPEYDVFFAENYDDNSSDSSNDASGDDSSQSCSKSPIIEMPNDKEVGSSLETRLHESRTGEKISLEIVPVSSQLGTATNAQAFPTSSKIAANFNDYPRRNHPNSSMLPVYPGPIPPTSSAMSFPMMPRHPNAGAMLGFPMIQRLPNAGSIGGYPIDPRSQLRYPMEPRPNIRPAMPPSSQWSTNDFNTVNQNYEIPKYELKTPVVLVRPNEELRAICSYVVSPNEFYVHLANKNNLKIDLLGADLENFYSKCNSPNYFLRPGFKYCACKYIWNEGYLDGPRTTWFRAEVISMEEGNEAFVYLVDYGIKVRKNINDLRVLEQRFFVYDKMAQRCHLHDVPMMKKTNYAKDVSDYFKSLLVTKEGSPELKINVFNNVQTRACSLSVVVKLPGRNESINDEIIKFIAKFCDEDRELEWNPMSEDYHAVTNRLDYAVDNPLMATCGFIPKDEERVCKFYASTGRCHKKACRQEHVFMGEDIFTVDKVETFSNTFCPQKLPEEGSKIKLKVLMNSCITHKRSGKRFYAHWKYADEDVNKHGKYKYDNDDENILLQDGEYYDDEDEETLVTLMNALNDTISTRKYKFADLPAEGEMLIARVMEDRYGNSWYRAQVTEVHETFCVVFLIDFGVIKNIAKKYLRAMEPRFLHLPPQAIEFCVAGVEVIEDKWGPNEPRTSILSQWEDKVLDAYVVKRYNGYVEVHLKNEKGESIRSKLLETGKYRSVDPQFGEDSGPIPG
ncbi:hypothetical protein LSTR_LSTR003560 [Laodelphax striatellus]|uniref:C3H1-type domain-containing protein n=1 Tax=Laodelphax striatellus TaxID=195883 RepID=A0A482WLF4_LAOST|nr:hypothetical protein LSTR_LSTR003560 [Laodelphax striatellus]